MIVYTIIEVRGGEGNQILALHIWACYPAGTRELGIVSREFC